MNSSTAKPNHEAFNQLLKKHVSDAGIVNYLGFKTDVTRLDAYLVDLAKEYPSANWTKNEKLAFWINAYNAFTIKAILNHYPTNSITEIEADGAENIWKLNWIRIGNSVMSLDYIENDILRVEFIEPRIHFTINCASVSCPPLRNEAFTADKLELQLQEQSRKFLADSSRNIVTTNNLRLSQVFDWFKADFTKNGSLIEFLNKYSAVKISSSAKISYLDYDWNLNE